MKKPLGILLFLLAGVLGFSQSTKLTVTYQFANIEAGYDHDCKAQVLVDGRVVGESGVNKQSKSVSMTVQVPTGNHNLQVVNWALYEGTWEEHTIENNYSIDATYETSHNFGKPEKLYLLFDLDQGTLASWKKPVKAKKGGKK